MRIRIENTRHNRTTYASIDDYDMYLDTNEVNSISRILCGKFNCDCTKNPDGNFRIETKKAFRLAFDIDSHGGWKLRYSF